MGMHSLKNTNLLNGTHKRDHLYDFEQLNLVIKSKFETASEITLRIKFNVGLI